MNGLQIPPIANQISHLGLDPWSLMVEFPPNIENDKHCYDDVVLQERLHVPRGKGRPALEKDEEYVDSKGNPCNPRIGLEGKHVLGNPLLV